MNIDFSCSNCGKHLRAPEGAAGRKSRCPDCGNIAEVPVGGPPPLPSISQAKPGFMRSELARLWKPDLGRLKQRILSANVVTALIVVSLVMGAVVIMGGLYHQQKTQQGYVLFEWHYVTEAKMSKILAERKERAEEEDRRMAEAERRRQGERRQRQQEQAVLARSRTVLNKALQFTQANNWVKAYENFLRVSTVLDEGQLSLPTSVGEARKMRAQATSGIEQTASHLTFQVTVQVKDESIMNSYPKWAADHQLLVNGVLVSTMTNQSSIATFENVVVRIGDIISAKSLWKNGFGAVAEVFSHPVETTNYNTRNGWPIVDLEHTGYYIAIRRY